MVLDAVSNFVRGTADAEVGTDDTTVSVEDASIFPDPETDGEFNVVIWDVNNFPRPDQDGDVEIMRVTARDTGADELTVVRGQETTSDVAHPEGSAIHLSPTAKMFSDIESTFGDFWDAGNQELTADVNNTNTTTTSLEAEQLNTEPTGAFVQLDGDQSLADTTVADVEWETESSRGEVSDLLDTTNNVVVVPEGFDFAKVKLNYDVGNDGPAIDLADPRRNGSGFAGGPAYNDDQNGLMRSVDVASAWFPVSENDEISSRIRVQGTDVSLNDNDRTYMEVWLI